MKTILTLSLSCILSAYAFAQSSLTIDKLEKSAIAGAKKEVAFSTLLEGTVSDPNLEVFVFVKQPHLKAWRVFPATIDTIPEAKGQYRWRAICQFGELKGTGVGDNYQARAFALDKQTIKDGLPQKIPAESLKTEVIVLKRTR